MRIIRRMACAGLLFLAPNIGAAQASPIEVRVDRRVELLSIIFRLAGADEFKSPYPSYSAAIDSFFTPFKTHPIIEEVRRLRRERGISFDAVMSFAVHLTDPPALQTRMPFAESQIESRWRADEATRFAELVRSFASESHVERFFAGQAALYDTAARRMTRLISENVDQPWFAKFFGPAPNARFIVVAALNNGGVAYGTRFYPKNGARELYAMINAMDRDSLKMPAFSRALVPTIVHEFSHSFVNPIVDAHLTDISPAADTVHVRVARAMTGQGYREPRTMVSESIVRAAVARYVLDHTGIDSAAAELAEQRLRSFYWIDDLYALLGAYGESRTQFQAFSAFWPSIAGYYRDLSTRIDGVMKQADRRRPAVVETTPIDGATNVDPSLTVITVRFSEPMRASFATMIGKTGREHFPEQVGQRWDDARRVFTMVVKLKPDWDYDFGFNSLTATGFASQEGYALAPYHMTFRTGPAKSP